MIPVMIISAIVLMGGTIWGFYIAKKRSERNRKRIILISILSMVLVAVSWFTNMGWIRFILTIMLIPFFHAIIFFLTNLFASAYVNKSPNIKLLNQLFCATYLIAYIFLPDGGDVGGLYFFFGLIHSDVLSYISQAISGIAFLGHIILFILQVIQIVKVKKEVTSYD